MGDSTINGNGLSFKPAGFKPLDSLFIMVQKEGEGNIGDDGTIKKNKGVNAEISLSNTYDPKNRWGITPESLEQYNKQFTAPITSKQKSIEYIKREIKRIEEDIKSNKNPSKKLTLKLKLDENISLLKNSQQELIILKNSSHKNIIKYDDITFDVAKKIFLDQYYDKPDFEKLPESIATIASDWGFVCHPQWPTKALAKIVGVSKPDELSIINDDVVIKMNEYIRQHGEQKLVSELSKEYKSYLIKIANKDYKSVEKGQTKYKKLKFSFLEGWKSRTDRIKEIALKKAEDRKKEIENEKCVDSPPLQQNNLQKPNILSRLKKRLGKILD